MAKNASGLLGNGRLLRSAIDWEAVEAYVADSRSFEQAIGRAVVIADQMCRGVFEDSRLGAAPSSTGRPKTPSFASAWPTSLRISEMRAATGRGWRRAWRGSSGSDERWRWLRAGPADELHRHIDPDSKAGSRTSGRAAGNQPPPHVRRGAPSERRSSVGRIFSEGCVVFVLAFGLYLVVAVLLDLKYRHIER